MFKNFNWALFTFALIIVALIGSIVAALAVAHQESVKDWEKREQCTTACYPYAVMSSEDKYCLCANTSTVLWRKDIK